MRDHDLRKEIRTKSMKDALDRLRRWNAGFANHKQKHKPRNFSWKSRSHSNGKKQNKSPRNEATVVKTARTDIKAWKTTL